MKITLSIPESKEKKLIKAFGENWLDQDVNDLGPYLTVKQIEDVKRFQEFLDKHLLNKINKECGPFLNEKHILNSDMAMTFLKNKAKKTTTKEFFGVLFLASDGKIIQDKTMSLGTIDKTAVYPREILKEALLCNSVFILLYHNHPGGGLEASRQDIHITEVIHKALGILEIELLDHFIITTKGVMSCRDSHNLTIWNMV